MPNIVCTECKTEHIYTGNQIMFDGKKFYVLCVECGKRIEIPSEKIAEIIRNIVVEKTNAAY